MSDTEKNRNLEMTQKPCVDCGKPTLCRVGPWPARCKTCRQEVAKQRSRETHKQTRQRRKEQGLCISCGVNPLWVVEKEVPQKGSNGSIETKKKIYTMCQSCYERTRANYIKLYGERPPKQPKPELTPEERQEKWRRYHRERREKLLQANPNLCTHCLKRNRDPEYTYCSVCRERINEINNNRNKKRRSQNLCLICATPTGGLQYCEKCRKTTQDYNKKHRKEKNLTKEC